MNAVPMIQACAARQLEEDPPQWAARRDRLPLSDEDNRPNLMLRTGPTCDDDCPLGCDDDAHHGLSLPILSLREG